MWDQVGRGEEDAFPVRLCVGTAVHPTLSPSTRGRSTPKGAQISRDGSLPLACDAYDKVMMTRKLSIL
jgi:hypothetical protein